MRITAIRECTVPIGASMHNASIAFDGMTASALAIVTDHVGGGRKVVGYAFDSIGRYGKGGLLRERFMPRLLAADPHRLLDESGLIDPLAATRVAMQNEKSGGHGERPGAIGLLEAALWDARAKAGGEPLWRVLARRFAHPGANGTIPVYASCGHFRPGAAGNALQDEVKHARDLGYLTVKIKVSGDLADDLERIEAASACMPVHHLAVDVNGALSEAAAQEWMARVSALPLAWIEEPCSPLDFALLAEIARNCPCRIATGENLFSFDDARNLLRYGGLRSGRDRIQIDILLAYGIGEYERILQLYRRHGWGVDQFYPHAGHLLAAHTVAGLGLGSAEAAADPTLSYGGFWDGTEVRDGRVDIPDLPGVGFEGKANLYRLLEPLAR
jgi:D(-)-tartrate dehydratase